MRRTMGTTSGDRPRARSLGALGFLALLAAVGFGTVAGGATPASALRHLTLDHALPGPDSVMATPVTEVRLHFSEPPQMRATSVRVVDASRSLVTTSPPSAFEGDERQVFVTIESPLAPGAYTVQWRVMALDGHVQRGDYSFRVASE